MALARDAQNLCAASANMTAPRSKVSIPSDDLMEVDTSMEAVELAAVALGVVELLAAVEASVVLVLRMPVMAAVGTGTLTCGALTLSVPVMAL